MNCWSGLKRLERRSRCCTHANKLKERNIRCVGTSDDAPRTIYGAGLNGPVALVLGAEGEGLRQLTQDMRRTGQHSDARRGGKPERIGGQRLLPL